MNLTRASLTHLGNLESITVLWNPEGYTVSRRSRFVEAAPLGGSANVLQGLSGGEQHFSTRLLLDGTRLPPEQRDLRSIVDKLHSWMEPEAMGGLPPRVLFLWGTFRFRGVLLALDEEWSRFEADGTPLRGWLRLTMRG